MSALRGDPDCYFVHDLAIHPCARGSGMANAAVRIVVADAKAAGFATVGLVAVGSAHDFWKNQGFTQRSSVARPRLRHRSPAARSARIAFAISPAALRSL
ncbi:GNAT family N-acetyltransferase [Sphingomonas sp. S1-29]|uniref:GNAT family N-acetyltransferase n=1 Tax=Sphingomonas sp. S1-29 TaxID=2991074 RepID=UPI003A0FE3E7